MTRTGSIAAVTYLHPIQNQHDLNKLDLDYDQLDPDQLEPDQMWIRYRIQWIGLCIYGSMLGATSI